MFRDLKLAARYLLVFSCGVMLLQNKFTFTNGDWWPLVSWLYGVLSGVILNVHRAPARWLIVGCGAACFSLMNQWIQNGNDFTYDGAIVLVLGVFLQIACSLFGLLCYEAGIEMYERLESR